MSAYPTDLSVTPWKWELADGDQETFAFNAEETISIATAEVVRLDTLAIVGGPVAVGDGASGTIHAVTLAGNIVSVTVKSLTRGVDYELSVTFQTAAGRKWTRTLAIPCVA